MLVRLQLDLIHSCWIGAVLIRSACFRRFLIARSARLGQKYDSPQSKKIIPKFIEARFPLDAEVDVTQACQAFGGTYRLQLRTVASSHGDL